MNLSEQCCCSEKDPPITCEEWEGCAPAQITLPRLVLSRTQRTLTSACITRTVTMTITITNLVWVFDVFDGCYYPTSGTIQVSWYRQNLQIWAGVFDINVGDCCPSCLECCESSTQSFEGAAQPITLFGKSICCVLPCGASSSSALIKMEFEEYVTGIFNEVIRDPAQPNGCCAQIQTYTDEPWTFPIGFNLWLRAECMSINTWTCRSVDFRTWDTQFGGTFYNLGFAGGRIDGGGTKLGQICSGAYVYERPLCVPDEFGIPRIPTLTCLNVAHGSTGIHYNVQSCTLDDYGDTGGLALCGQLRCIDSTYPTFGPTCCQRQVQICQCIPFCGFTNCPSGPVGGCGPIECNSDGLLDWIRRTDSLTSEMAAPTIP